jgi:hypothetical protein
MGCCSDPGLHTLQESVAHSPPVTARHRTEGNLQHRSLVGHSIFPQGTSAPHPLLLLTTLLGAPGKTSFGLAWLVQVTFVAGHLSAAVVGHRIQSPSTQMSQPRKPLFIYLGSIRSFKSGPELARQVLYHLSHASSPFCFSYFLDRVSCFLPAASFKPWYSYPSFPHSWNYRCEPPCPAYLLRWRSCKLFT